MGLDTSHGCWHGAYSAFNRWREKLADVLGIPPLRLMAGFYDGDSYSNPLYKSFKDDKEQDRNKDFWDALPISWEVLKPNPIYELLHHSDCDGEIPWESCDAIADELEKLIPLLPAEEAGGHIGNWRDKTATFVAGLRLASNNKENVDFH